MKTINKITKGIKIIAGFSVLYPLTLLGIQGISQETSPKINNQSQLEQILEIERKKLDKKIKKDITINAILGSPDESYSRKMNEREYEIYLLHGKASESTLRHELYHIADRHCDDKKSNFFKYFFIYEPQATIYEITGLKP